MHAIERTDPIAQFSRMIDIMGPTEDHYSVDDVRSYLQVSVHEGGMPQGLADRMFAAYIALTGGES